MDREKVLRLLGGADARLRALYETAGIQFQVSSGAGRLLADATALLLSGEADGRIPASIENQARLQSCIVLRDTMRAVEICVGAGQDIEHHLHMLRYGDVDFGVRGRAGERGKFKDFQYEIFVLATFIRRGLKARLTSPGDPAADIIVDPGIHVEVKHASVPSKLHRYAREFDAKLRGKPVLGVLALGLEDAFGFGQRQHFRDQAEFGTWMNEKLEQVERFWLTEFVHTIAGCGGILGVVETVRLTPFIGNTLELVQFGIGHVFAGPGVHAIAREHVENVLRTITPDVRVHHQLLAACPTPVRGPDWAGFRLRVPIDFTPGRRLGVYHAQGDALHGLVYECRRVRDGVEMEMVRVVGTVYEAAGVQSLQRQMVSCIALPCCLTYHPDAYAWFSRRGAPLPTAST